MKNFNTIDIIGGVPNIPGSKFDNYQDLIDKYYALLFFSLTKNGITYSTNRNARLAQVKTCENGFINYVQPSIGKWDYENQKYQRFVSPEFVLYLFNNICMAESLYEINALAESIRLGKNQTLYPNGIDLNEFNVGNIIKLHESYAEEFFKYQNGYPNDYLNIPKSKIVLVNLFYSLVEQVTKFSEKYVKYQMQLIRKMNLKEDLKAERIDYEDLSEKDKELVHDDYYTEEYDWDNPNVYLSLGCFNNSIRKKAVEALYKRQQKNCSQDKQDVAKLQEVRDPILIREDDESEMGYRAKIDYMNAKEFEQGNDLKLERAIKASK